MNTIRPNEHHDMPTDEVWHYVGKTLKFLRTDVAAEAMFDVEVGAVVLLQQMNILRARDALSTQTMTEASLDTVNQAIEGVRSLVAQRGSYADIQWGVAEVLVALLHAKANDDKARMAEVIEEAVMGHLKGIAMRRTQVGTSRQPTARK